MSARRRPSGFDQQTLGPSLLGLPATDAPRREREPGKFPVPPSSPLKAGFSCHAPVHWIVTDGGRKMPVNPDGTTHFATCPNAAQHRRPR